ncbi:MAG TPA: pentapeptide repeat-containing protein [Pirellulales bacterium]|nr:pentapeptide repeat-containing protein [Pirellulales bacterium]
MKIFKATRDHQNLSGKEHPFEGDVGPGENLSGANLRGVDLTRTNLSKADLAVADLGRADLSGADLRGATHWDRADWRNASCFHRRKPKWPAGMDPKKFGITVYPPAKKK